MDWSSGDLPGAWRSFKQHCKFMFGGPLKGKEEDEQCNYLMIWVGEKGRDIYNTGHSRTMSQRNSAHIMTNLKPM